MRVTCETEGPRSMVHLQEATLGPTRIDFHGQLKTWIAIPFPIFLTRIRDKDVRPFTSVFGSYIA